MSKLRKSPSESATEFPVGTIKRGNDGNDYVVTKTVTNVSRWTPFVSTKLFGYQPLTVNYLAKHINKPIKIYECEYSDKFPTTKTKMYKFTFIPSGNAGVLKRKPLINWLKTQKPPIKDRTVFGIYGSIDSDKDSGLQVDSMNKQSVSTNISNMVAYVKV